MSLENLEPTFEPTLAPTMLRSLKTLALQHKKRLFATFGLVAAENFLLLIYPLVGSFAVNAVLNGQLVSALAYALMVLIIWGVAMCALFGVTLTVLTLKQGVTAGHIYAVITYLWTFAISLDDAPRLVEELSKLKDIGKRVEV